MKSLHKHPIATCVSLFALSAIFVSIGFSQEGVKVIEGLRLPMEFYENGSLKTQITAVKANVPMKGDISGEGVTGTVFTPEGNTNVILKAKTCTFDRENMLVLSDSDVSIQKTGSIKITGVGLEWHMTNKVVRILNNTRVVLKKGGTFKGLTAR